jgi:hypothetical protein
VTQLKSCNRSDSIFDELRLILYLTWWPASSNTKSYKLLVEHSVQNRLAIEGSSKAYIQIVKIVLKPCKTL